MGAQLIVVTGASRGFGRAAAIEISRAVAETLREHSTSTAVPSESRPPVVRLLLVSRDAAGVAETGRLCTAALASIRSSLHVMSLAGPDFDLGRRPVSDAAERIAAAVAACAVEDSGEGGGSTHESGQAAGGYERAFIIHNAGTLGRIGEAADGSATAGEVADSLSEALDLNVVGFVALTTAVAASSALQRANGTARVHIVGVSSLLALVPMRAHTDYCVVKAARDMALRVLAEEHNVKERPDAVIKALSYAPGPMDTDMQVTLRRDSPAKDMWIEMRDSNKLVDVNDSAKRLAMLLCADEYVSGAHVDFFDDI